MLKRVSSGSSLRLPRARSSSSVTPHSAAKVAEVLVHQLGAEAVDARRDRCVGREHTAGAHDLDRLGECETRADELADALERVEAGVSLVAVEHLGVDAQRAKGSHTADAEDDLLAQAVLDVAAVQPVGDLCRESRALPRHRSVEQVQRDAADVDPPHLDVRHVAGEVDAHRHAGRRDRQPGAVEAWESLLLPAVGVEPLAEVALGVEQADADERHAEIASRLEVIAGEDPETTGILRESLGDAELGREVGDGTKRAVRAALEPTWRAQGLVEPGGGRVDVGDDERIGSELCPALDRDALQHTHRVVAGRLPAHRVESREQRLEVSVPRPVQVAREAAQGAQALRDRGIDSETPDGTHTRPRVQATGGTAPHSRLKPAPPYNQLGDAWRGRLSPPASTLRCRAHSRR